MICTGSQVDQALADPLKVQQMTYRHKMVKKKLIANCKGLLEPRYHSSKGKQLSSAIIFDYR